MVVYARPVCLSRTLRFFTGTASRLADCVRLAMLALQRVLLLVLDVRLVLVPGVVGRVWLLRLLLVVLEDLVRRVVEGLDGGWSRSSCQLEA